MAPQRPVACVWQTGGITSQQGENDDSKGKDVNWAAVGLAQLAQLALLKPLQPRSPVP